jgi:hypothetical protein
MFATTKKKGIPGDFHLRSLMAVWAMIVFALLVSASANALSAYGLALALVASLFMSMRVVAYLIWPPQSPCKIGEYPWLSEIPLPRARIARNRVHTPKPLPLSALNPAIDRSTCGRLLDTKRTSDLRDFIRRETQDRHAAKPKPLKGEETALDRLVTQKRVRAGVAVTEATGVGGVWDRWLDG